MPKKKKHEYELIDHRKKIIIKKKGNTIYAL